MACAAPPLGWLKPDGTRDAPCPSGHRIGGGRGGLLIGTGQPAGLASPAQYRIVP